MKMSECPLRFRSVHRVLSSRANALSALILSSSLLAGCAARQTAATIANTPDTPGFLMGVWHGFIFPVAFICSLFLPDVAIYAVPNSGTFYDLGYFIGIVFLGVGARQTRTVYVDRWGDRR
jgi:hypothetical protein